MNAAEKRYLSKVAALGCVLCRALGHDGTPAEIHHPRFAAGGAQRAPHWLAIPLCPDCHRGTHGVHGDRGRMRQAKLDEAGLLALTIEGLNS